LQFSQFAHRGACFLSLAKYATGQNVKKTDDYVLAREMQFTGARRHTKEETTMKTTLTRKTTYIGAGAGLVLFALFGLMPGGLIGGAMGLNVAGWFFGLPLTPSLLSRVIVLASMLIGVLVAGIMIVTATSTLGWLVGRMIEAGSHAGAEAKSESK
jgi:hypothetical protein